MQNSIIRKTIDLQKSGVQFSVSATKNDSSSRTLMINITDGGKPYLITDDVTVIFYAVKPDGKFVFNNCSVVNESTVSIDLKTQTLNAPGIVEAQIRFESVGKLLTTSYFNIEVNDCNDYDGVIESSDEFSALTEATAKVNEFLNGADSQVKQAVETAEQAVETANAKIDKQQGIENAGRILKVGADGNIGLGDVKNHLKTKVLYSYEEFEAYMMELYENFSEYAPLWLIYGFDDFESNITVGTGMLILDDGTGTLENALIVDIVLSEIPFTSDLERKIEYNTRTRMCPLEITNDGNYAIIENYQSGFVRFASSIGSTKSMKLLITPNDGCKSIFVGLFRTDDYTTICIPFEDGNPIVLNIHFIKNDNGTFKQIIYDCNNSKYSKVVDILKPIAIQQIVVHCGGSINFTVNAYGEVGG